MCQQMEAKELMMSNELRKPPKRYKPVLTPPPPEPAIDLARSLPSPIGAILLVVML